MAFALDTSTVRSLAAGSYGMVSTTLNGSDSFGKSAATPLAIAWPNVSLTCMKTAVFGATLDSRKMSPSSTRPLRPISGAGGKFRNTNL